MAKHRLINTKFWSDNYISELDPSEKLLFLYFISNPFTNICGIYEITVRQIALDTGFDKEMIFKILERFERDKKIFYFDGWVWVKNFTKHQKACGNVQLGVEKALKDVPPSIMDKIKGIQDQRGSEGGQRGVTPPKSELEFESELELELEPEGAAKPQDVVNYFFELKGWANKEKNFYKKQKIVYARFLRPAKELLYLCDGVLKDAQDCLDKVSKWATSRELDWSIETVFKKWYDLNDLKEKEKKPYIEGMRAFQREGGYKWFVITGNGEIKEYVGDQKVTYK